MTVTITVRAREEINSTWRDPTFSSETFTRNGNRSAESVFRWDHHAKFCVNGFESMRSAYKVRVILAWLSDLANKRAKLSRCFHFPRYFFTIFVFIHWRIEFYITFADLDVLTLSSKSFIIFDCCLLSFLIICRSTSVPEIIRWVTVPPPILSPLEIV